MDTFDKEKRHQIMSKINSKNTSIELIVRRWLFAYGYRFRVNDKRYPGTPDIVLPKYKTVIFVHGCFWHGHHCPKGRLPKTNTEYWREKIDKNKARDYRVENALSQLGWRVIVIWGCEVRTDPEIRLIPLLSEISGMPLD